MGLHYIRLHYIQRIFSDADKDFLPGPKNSLCYIWHFVVFDFWYIWLRLYSLWLFCMCVCVCVCVCVFVCVCVCFIHRITLRCTYSGNITTPPDISLSVLSCHIDKIIVSLSQDMTTQPHLSVYRASPLTIICFILKIIRRCLTHRIIIRTGVLFIGLLQGVLFRVLLCLIHRVK